MLKKRLYEVGLAAGPVDEVFSTYVAADDSIEAEALARKFITEGNEEWAEESYAMEMASLLTSRLMDGDEEEGEPPDLEKIKREFTEALESARLVSLTEMGFVIF